MDYPPGIKLPDGDEVQRTRESNAQRNRVMLTFLSCLRGKDRNVMEYLFGFGINRRLEMREAAQLFDLSYGQIFQLQERCFAWILEACTHYFYHGPMEKLPKFKRAGVVQKPQTIRLRKLRTYFRYVMLDIVREAPTPTWRKLKGGARKVLWKRSLLKRRGLTYRMPT